MNSLKIDYNYLVRTLTDLISINSVNPNLETQGPGEVQIAIYIAEALRHLNLEVETYEPQPGRVSVVGRLKGSGGGRSLMLNGHTDTVGVAGMSNPFTPEERKGKLHGRGAYDMKGSIAACMAALRALVEAEISLRGDVLLVAVADEEYTSLGTMDIIQHFQTDGAIVTEPTEMNIALAHKGFIWLEVEILGRAAHGSRFKEGIDANMRMGRFLADLDKWEQILRSNTGHSLLGPPSLHTGILEGGSSWSMYAAHSRAKIERRTLPGETEVGVLEEIQSIIDKLQTDDPTFQATVQTVFARPPFEVSADSRIVQVLEQASEQILDQAPAKRGESYWSDAALLAEAGIETVLMGPKGGGAHADEEWVDLDSLAQLTAILAHTAIDYCQ